MSKLLRLLALSLVFVSSLASAQAPVRVGSTPSGIPFTFLDTKTNKISGVMVDLVNEIAKDQAFTVDINPMPFSSLIAALQGNKIDVIAAAMYITPPRQEVVDFSDPIYTYGEGLFVSSKDKKDYKAFEELKGETVGVQIGTAYVKPLQESGLFKEVKVYDSISDIMRDVNLGRIKAGFGDYPIVGYQLGLGSFPETRLVKSYKPVWVGSVGIAVRKGDKATLDKVNAALRKFKGNGTTDRVLARWNLN
jgi:polar amino acid transport system substrate-binding protein